MLGRIGRVGAVVIPIAIAAALFVIGVGNRPPPERSQPEERPRPVSAIKVTPTPFVPQVTGYGAVNPSRTWTAVAQVAGRIEKLSADLRVGAILRAGTEIIQISPSDYDLAVQEASANLEAEKAKLKELELQAANARQSRDLENRSLELQRNDLERKRQLSRRGTVSPATVEEAERAVIQQQSRVQDIENTLRLSPAQIEAQKRQIAVSQTRLQTAQLNLERTQIALPFDARIASVNVERTQFVAAGTTLATADDIGVAEVDAQIPLTQFRAFVTASLNGQQLARPDLTSADAVQKVLEQWGWTAEVRLRAGNEIVRWPAKVIRTTDTIDPKTRAISVTVAVDKPYADAQPGIRPPLVKGMFVQVVLSGRQQGNQIVIPRSAIREGGVFIANAQNRLERRAVQVGVLQAETALIRDGLKPGDCLLVAEVADATEKMLLSPIRADGAAAPDGMAQNDEASRQIKPVCKFRGQTGDGEAEGPGAEQRDAAGQRAEADQ